MNKAITSALVGLLLAGCNTTNAFLNLAPDYSDLPVEQLREVAIAIEKTVVAGSETFSLDAGEGIVVDTPDIRQAVRTRVLRYPLLDAFRETGFAVEEEDGLVSIRRSSAYKKATTSRQRDREAQLVMSENQNRWTIYEGLIKANNWPPRSLSAIQAIFYEVRVPLLPPEHLENGAGDS